MIVINESNFYNDRDTDGNFHKSRKSDAPKFIYNIDQLKKDPNLYGRLMQMDDKDIKILLKELGASGTEISKCYNKYKRVDKAYELLGGK